MWRPLMLFLLLGGAVLYASETSVDREPTWEQLSFKIEDSHCFVGIAPVYLTVSELKPEGGYLIGTYEVRVPMKKSKNDHGKIVLPLDVAVEDLGKIGGVLVGKAHSHVSEKQINKIVCEIIPDKDQMIKLEITTAHRTLNFKSRYTVIEPIPTEVAATQGGG